MGEVRSYQIDGVYLRDKVTHAYVACFQEGATEHDKAMIKAAPRLLEVLQIVRSEGVTFHSESVLRMVESAIQEAAP